MKQILTYLHVIFLISLCLTPDISFAKEEEVDIERIVVTPSRVEEDTSDVPRKIQLLGSKELETRQAHDLSDVLTSAGSVNISNYGGPGATKTLKMRGSTGSQVLVLVDGRPINSPRDGEIDLSTIPVENIEQIEIMHGPASSLYGSSAMGGVVQILTKKPPRQGATTEITSGFGTFRTYQERLLHGQRVGPLGYLVSGGYSSSEGFRENSALHSKDVNIKLDYDLSPDQTLAANAGFFTSTAGTPGLITDVDYDDKQRVRKNFVELSWRAALDPATTVSLKAYNTYDRLEFMENTAGSFFDIAFNKFIHATQVRGVDLQLDKQVNDAYRAVGGLNASLNFNDSTSSAKHDYAVYAGYLNNEFHLREDLRTDLGIRLDDYSNFGLQVSPSLSALYTFKDENKLHGLISRSFRAPTFNDLYWPNEGWAVGNPNLSPEKGTTGEIGIETELGPKFRTDLTYFRSFYDDLIQWAESGGVWSPTNIGSAVISGVEWENDWRPFQDFKISLNYTYQEARDDKTDQFLIYQPRHRINASIERQKVFGWTIGTRGQWTGAQFHDAANTVKMKGYFTLGFSASKTWNSGVTYYLNINNALNKKYQPVRDYPAPGFDLTSGLKYEF